MQETPKWVNYIKIPFVPFRYEGNPQKGSPPINDPSYYFGTKVVLKKGSSPINDPFVLFWYEGDPSYYFGTKVILRTI